MEKKYILIINSDLFTEDEATILSEKLDDNYIILKASFPVAESGCFLKIIEIPSEGN